MSGLSATMQPMCLRSPKAPLLPPPPPAENVSLSSSACFWKACAWLTAGFGDDMPFNYFTYGAACSEVELDSLTGDFQALRTHICMDVGSSVNPAIDIGQVEGGFIQVTTAFHKCLSCLSCKGFLACHTIFTGVPLENCYCDIQSKLSLFLPVLVHIAVQARRGPALHISSLGIRAGWV